MGQIKINDRTVTFDDAKAELGVKYILSMEHGEKESFFNSVKGESLAGRDYLFENRQGNNFSARRLSAGIYHIKSRGSDSGWF